MYLLKRLDFNMFKWSRYHSNGYELSSDGDKRFSALFARLKDGRTIEEAYQLDVKGYRKLGYDWKQAKKDKGINIPNKLTESERYIEYLKLWRQWADENSDLVEDLRIKALGKVLTDKFATSNVSQARALADILNSLEQN